MLIGLVFGLTVSAEAQVSVPANYPTIQAAIDAAVRGELPDGVTINVQRGTYAENLTVAHTGRSFTVRGVGGADATVVNAAGRGAPALYVYRATGQVTFAGLTFRNAAPPNGLGGGFLVQESSPSFVGVVVESNRATWGGGGALITSNANFTACVIRNNVADRSGGGLFIDAGSRPVLTSTDITGNRAGAIAISVGELGVGGGVDVRNSSPTFRAARINGNASTFAAGGIYHGGEFSSPHGVATLTLIDSQIADNLASPLSGAAPPSEGGGVHIEDNATAQLNRVRVMRNTANSGGGLNAYRARYDLVDSIVEDNRAVARSDGGGGGGTGGGIYAHSTNVADVRPPSIVVLTRSLVRRNIGITAGGLVVTGDVGQPATLSLADSVVDSNQAQNQGGGILVSNAALYTANALIMRNVVSGGGTPFGGGIAVLASSSANISNSTIAGNTATGHGGGLYIFSTGALTMTGSRVASNVSSTNFGGGGIFVGPSGRGSVSSSIIGDNAPYQIVEHGAPCPTVTYSNNTIAPSGNVQNCGASTFSGNNSNVPRFAHVLAAPTYGTGFTLAWAFGRATSVSVSGVGTFSGAMGTVDVAPGGSTNYSVNADASSANGGDYPAVVVGVGHVAPPVGPRGRAITTHGDFDGDGRADVTVYRPSSGSWYHRFWSGAVGTVPHGLSNDLVAPADFDGDGRANQTVFRPSTGTWYSNIRPRVQPEVCSGGFRTTCRSPGTTMATVWPILRCFDRRTALGTSVTWPAAPRRLSSGDFQVISRRRAISTATV